MDVKKKQPNRRAPKRDVPATEQEPTPEAVAVNVEPDLYGATHPAAEPILPPGVRSRASLRTKGPIGARPAAPSPPE